MGKLIYGLLVSLDGFIETATREIDWIPMDEELHRFFNEDARDIGLSLYGRRLYEVMSPWQTRDTDPAAPDYEVEFAHIWQAMPKLVFSKTLNEVGPNARLVTEIVPEDIRKLKDETDKHLEVGGPNLASQFMRLGLIDEYRLYVCPVILGGGTPFFPAPGVPIKLRFAERQEFQCGVIYLRYQIEGVTQ